MTDKSNQEATTQLIAQLTEIANRVISSLEETIQARSDSTASKHLARAEADARLFSDGLYLMDPNQRAARKLEPNATAYDFKSNQDEVAGRARERLNQLVENVRVHGKKVNHNREFGLLRQSIGQLESLA